MNRPVRVATQAPPYLRRSAITCGGGGPWLTCVPICILRCGRHALLHWSAITSGRGCRPQTPRSHQLRSNVVQYPQQQHSQSVRGGEVGHQQSAHLPPLHVLNTSVHKGGSGPSGPTFPPPWYSTAELQLSHPRSELTPPPGHPVITTRCGVVGGGGWLISPRAAAANCPSTPC